MWSLHQGNRSAVFLASVLLAMLQLGAVHVGSRSWTPHTPSSIARTEAACVLYEGKLFVVAGFTLDVIGTHVSEVYDPATDTWSEIAPIPRSVTHVGSAVVDGNIWVVGGFEGDHPGPAVDIVQIYDIAADSWSDGPALPSPRASGTLALLGRDLHYVGGLLPDRQTDLNEHLVLDVDRPQDGWSPAEPLPDPRNHLSSAVFEGQLYAIGGQFGHDGGRTLSSRVHIYDVATDTWQRRANLPLRRSHAEASTFVYNGRIIMAGGVGPGSNQTASLDQVTAYDPSTDTWSELDLLPAKLLGPEARVIDSRLVVANGSIGLSGNAQSTVWSMPVEPLEADTLGFWPKTANVQVNEGESQSIRVLLWTHHHEAAYTVPPDGFPDWLSVGRLSQNTAGPSGSPLELTIDASQLAVGVHTAIVRAAAPGYPDATFEVTTNVISGPLSTDSETPESSSRLVLGANYPNPFAGATTIPYVLDQGGTVTLSIYNLLGERIAVPFNGSAPQGMHTIAFDAEDLSNGLYFYELRAGDVRKGRWMTLIR